MKYVMVSSAFVISLLLIAPVLAEEVLTFTFDNAPLDIQRDEIWQEHGLDLWITETIAEDDIPGESTFDVLTGSIGLAPARLMIDIGYDASINRVEIDIASNCGYVGCTRAFLYLQNATTGSAKSTELWMWISETLVLTPGFGRIDSIGVSSGNGWVFEVRIYSDAAPNEQKTWGTIKSLSR